MEKTIKAVYENGVFRPLEHVDCREHQIVSLHILKATNSQKMKPTVDSELFVDDDIDPFWRGVFVVDWPESKSSKLPLDIKISKGPAPGPVIDVNPRWFEDDD